MDLLWRALDYPDPCKDIKNLKRIDNMPRKFFLKVQTTCMKHPRGFPEAGERSARRIMMVRHVEQKRRNEKQT